MARNFISPRETARIKAATKKLLVKKSGLTEAAIAKALDADKGNVAQVLMGSLDVFRATGNENNPQWRLHTPHTRKMANSKAEKQSILDSKRAIRQADSSGKKKIQKTDRTDLWDTGHGAAPLPSVASLKLFPWQKEAFRAWEHNEYRGIVNAVTGAGKTRLAMRAIHFQLSRRGRVVIIVPTLSLMDQWYESVKQQFPGRRVARLGGAHKQSLHDGQILIALVASGRKWSFDLPRTGSCLLVADECHRYASEINRKVLEERFDRRLGLTATNERMDDLHLTVLNPYFGDVVYTLDLVDATAAGIVAPLRIAQVQCEMSKKSRKRYEQISDDMATKVRALEPAFKSPVNDFASLWAEIERIAGGTSRYAPIAKAWVALWAERRSLVFEAPEKLAALQSLSAAIQDADRVLVFVMTTEGADLVAKQLRHMNIRAAAHSSAVQPGERESMLRQFADGNLKVLVAAMTLDEGIDIPEADLAIVLATTQQRRQMIQRVGRILRRKPDKRFARLVHVYFPDTFEDPNTPRNEIDFTDLYEAAKEVANFRLPRQKGAVRQFLRPKRRAKTIR